MPVVSTIFQVLNTPVDERDQVAANEKKMLQRGYFSFIATLVNTNVPEVLSNQGVCLQRNWNRCNAVKALIDKYSLKLQDGRKCVNHLWKQP